MYKLHLAVWFCSGPPCSSTHLRPMQKEKAALNKPLQNQSNIRTTWYRIDVAQRRSSGEEVACLLAKEIRERGRVRALWKQLSNGKLQRSQVTFS